MKRTPLARKTPLARTAMKRSRPKASNGLRLEAKGRPCLVRLPGCDGGGETTVLAHYRMAGECGMGLKPDDMPFGAWACFSCHEIVDGRAKAPDGYTKTDLRLALAEAVLRTIHARLNMVSA